ncbi:MAG: hypothetical protein ACOC86_05195 [Candidatus Bipolaricaulota bacterium]
MNKTLTTISVIALVVLTASTIGLAAEDSATVTVGWTINAQQSLTISSNGSSSSGKSVESVYDIPEPDDNDLQRGHIREQNAVELVASSNVDWEVKVEAINQDLGTSDDGDYTKPVSDLSIRGQGSFKPVSANTPTTIAEGKPGEHKFGVDYQISYDEDEYEEGDYTAELEYTISVR